MNDFNRTIELVDNVMLWYIITLIIENGKDYSYAEYLKIDPDNIEL
ncbi:MAG: hypothetical protein AMQ74_01050 [Candidatus Methanofastidiosum methylothiophilum]|jgi:hypothetical protein|uniref:Uncharacterized protein n=1 Tax=Candidatus Methanofastidiosum methylothiophilum TaxID=1705564 RepID=A0A150J3E3_9EURY|nr:MAG: hypothetical protein AMQ74_01050 [Candidatus Methanofastidiosum methylthiophilus]